MSWFNIFGDVTDLASEYIEDKDKRNELNAKLRELQHQVYLTELNTKTIPWVDALHKMGRQIISLVTIAGAGALIYLKPEIDPMAIVSMVAPGGIYNFIKGQGR